MGLGKTLQSVALIYALLKTGITANGVPTAKRIIIVCPCSLVKNWDNEFVKWLGPGVVKTLALADGDRKTIEKNIDCFARLKLFNVLIASYECIRTHVKLLSKHKDCCDLLVCDEAHRLKNSDNQTSRALNSLPVQRRVLLTGTPMQNDLTEFYAMVDFTNPGILGTPEEFRRRMMFPILRGREPDATESQKRKMSDLQNDLSTIVEDFILRRVNTLNAEHLPPKLVQVVCCNLTDIQQQMYNHLITSKDMQHVMDGKQVNCLASIQLLMKLSNHPSLVCDDDPMANNSKIGNSKRSTAKQVKYNEDPEKESTAAPGADGISRFLPYAGGGGRNAPVHPEWSGKMYVLFRLMKEMRKPGNGSDKIVVISNYTQTLDLIGRMCRENNWGFCRLDGSVTMKKRQSMVDDFNDPSSSLVAFLLSSKAGGCGLNLIGGNRLVLFDPDWNPAVDKQAAARCWRDGQKKRCFTYRFLATGTVEEKIFQRQLSKEGLQSVVDDKEQVNALSTKDLKNLFKLRVGTPSDTHDKLQCKRCTIVHDNAEMEAEKVLPKKLAACRELLDDIATHTDAQYFLRPLDATLYGRTKEQYEALVKQPMDFETIRKKLDQPTGNPSAYTAPSSFSKDVNRIFGNVAKMWDTGEEIADASKRLQTDWLKKWTELVPILMCMKADNTDAEVGLKAKDSVDELLQSCATINNERGEDYQEQIGMPDEENMRLWSHHYSTDTVDDPVFRAAMRGTDAVSFVFGLEVTWSNIQARQQAEEEAEAAKAFDLDALEEDDTANGNSKITGDGDISQEAEATSRTNGSNVDRNITKSDHTNQDSSDEESDVDEEDLKSFIDNDENSESSHNDDFEDVQDCLITNKEDQLSEEKSGHVDEVGMKLSVASEAFSLQVTPNVKQKMCSTVTVSILPDTSVSPCIEAEIVDTSPESIDIVADTADSSPDGEPSTHVYASIISTNKATTSPEKGKAATTTMAWACVTCTLFNKKSARKCSACGTRKPNTAISQTDSSRKKRTSSEIN
jgi:DNA repair and recombination protein RAD54 and RAD54-like protein